MDNLIVVWTYAPKEEGQVFFKSMELMMEYIQGDLEDLVPGQSLPFYVECLEMTQEAYNNLPQFKEDF